MGRSETGRSEIPSIGEKFRKKRIFQGGENPTENPNYRYNASTGKTLILKPKTRREVNGFH